MFILSQTLLQLTLVDVALDHDSHDAILALGDLTSDISSNLGLVLVILGRVSVAAVNHNSLSNALLLKRLLGKSNVLSIEVGALGTTSEDNEAVVVALGTNNGDNTRLGHWQVHGGAGSQFIQHFAGDRHALGSQVNKELSRDAQTLVDLKAAINIGVVDQTLPADSCARLLKVGSHNDKKLILMLLLLLQEEVAVGKGSRGVVDGTWANDNEQSVLLVGAIDNSDSFIASFEDRLFRFGGLGDFVLEQVWGSQRVVTTD
ncbi:hypothetical protein HG531_002332 [Fusarium graminearum]|nr:hypothetical protein HG531_002332 [Fusarium graminearum]